MTTPAHAVRPAPPTVGSMNPRTARLLPPLALGGVALLATAYLGLVDPNQPGHYPLCPTKALSGLDCPGCGGLRAVHSLVHLDFVGALDHNAFVVLVVLPAAIAVWIAWVVRVWRGPSAPSDDEPVRAPKQGLARPSVVWSLVAVMVVFTVIRNIDTVPALAWFGSGAS
jgi:hypothetical protein